MHSAVLMSPGEDAKCYESMQGLGVVSDPWLQPALTLHSLHGTVRVVLWWSETLHVPWPVTWATASTSTASYALDFCSYISTLLYFIWLNYHIIQSVWLWKMSLSMKLQCGFWADSNKQKVIPNAYYPRYSIGSSYWKKTNSAKIFYNPGVSLLASCCG